MTWKEETNKSNGDKELNWNVFPNKVALDEDEYVYVQRGGEYKMQFADNNESEMKYSSVLVHTNMGSFKCKYVEREEKIETAWNVICY